MFESQTPLPDRAEPTDLLPAIIEKLASGPNVLEPSDWRKLIRLSEESKRKGAAVWEPYLEDVVKGVAGEWKAVSAEKRKFRTNVKVGFLRCRLSLSSSHFGYLAATEGRCRCRDFPDLPPFSSCRQPDRDPSINILASYYYRMLF